MNNARRGNGRGRQRRRRGGARGSASVDVDGEGNDRKEEVDRRVSSGSPQHVGKGSDVTSSTPSRAENVDNDHTSGKMSKTGLAVVNEAETVHEEEVMKKEEAVVSSSKSPERKRDEQASKSAEVSERRRVLRVLNQQFLGDLPAKPRISEAELRKLDSSVKKCTAFIRKLRGSGITEDSHKSLLSDVRMLNLSRYISEIVAAISECRLRTSDTEYAAVLASELHQRFEDFSSELTSALTSVVLSNQSNASRDLGNRRGAMRLLVELYVLGMNPDVSAVTSVLRELVKGGRDCRDLATANLCVLASFVRCAPRVFLSQPDIEASRDGMSMVDNWEDSVTILQTKQAITSALESYYMNEASKLYEESRNELRDSEIAVIRARQTRGSVDDASLVKRDAAKGTCEKLFTACSALADALNLAPPSPVWSVEEIGENNAADAGSAFAVVPSKASNGRVRDCSQPDLRAESESLFENEEDRSFYTELPDMSRPPDTARRDESLNMTSGNLVEGAGARGDPKQSMPCDERVKPKPVGLNDAEKKEGNKSGKKKNDKSLSLDHLLARLGATETKESADRFTYQFIKMAESSRKATQRLAKSLLAVSPHKLNVLPAYSRIAASLKKVCPDVALIVSESLEREFKIFADRTDVDEKTLCSCVKTARYVGEYCKFRLLDYESVFGLLLYCIKELDFTGHRIDMTCHLLESCGRLMYRTPSHSIRMGNLLDTVWRLRAVKNLEPRHNTLVETAFHAARPAVGGKLHRRKERPALQEYIRRLIYSWLTPDNVRWTALQMKRLPWDNETEAYVIKKFVKVVRMKFSTIPDVALLIAAVGKYRKEVQLGVVDGVLEAIRAGMERNDGRDAQRRVSEVALLAELYNANVVSERVIFYVLYQFITLGHGLAPVPLGVASSGPNLLNSDTSGNNLEPANDNLDLNSDIQTRRLASSKYYLIAPDPPKDYFRSRLVCVLIEACGFDLFLNYRRKTQVFWVLFERYVYWKAMQSGLEGQLPLHVDHILADAFEKMTGRRIISNTSASKLISESSSRVRVRSRNEEQKKGSPTKLDESKFSDGEWRRALSFAEAMKNADSVENDPDNHILMTFPERCIRTDHSPGKWSLENASASDNVGKTNKQWTGLKDSRPQSSSSKIPGFNGPRNGSDTSPDGDAEDDLSINTEEDDFDEIGIDLTIPNDFDREAADDERSEHSDFDYEDDGDEEVEDEDDDDDDLFMENVRPRTEEEDMFEKELAAFTAASVQSARENPPRVPTLNRMAIPMGLMAQKLAEERAAAAIAEDDTEKQGTKRFRRVQDQVGFKFLIRKGGKSQIQDLAVPATSSLAVAARESESVGAAEQEEKKRLVLGSSIIVNGDEDDSLEHVVLRTHQDVKAKEQSIRQRRTDDEAALLATLFSHRSRR